MREEYDTDDLLHLWNVVCKFVQEQSIGHAECIYQNDNVSLNSLEFIEQCCGIVGYAEPEENDD